MSIRQNTRFMVITALLLLAGFACTSVVGYYVANQSLNHHIQTNTLPITSDNIYSEIQRDLLQPILVSSLMAQDTFVRQWAINGEKDPSEIIRYLDNIQKSYQTITAFFISEANHQYYHSTGILKTVAPSDPQDAWYFRLENLPAVFEINLDADTAAADRTTLFVNHKVYDFNNRYLGAIGVGLSSQKLQEMIALYQDRYQRGVYFIDHAGKVVLHGSAFTGATQIQQRQGMKNIATRILTSPGGSYDYVDNGQTSFINTRFVPELNWFIVVEQNGHHEGNITTALKINLGLSLIVTLAVLLLAYITLGNYQRKLELKANTDQLTGTASRHAFEPIMESMMSLAKRSKSPLSVIMVDIDHFKAINDRYGHLKGDQVLMQVARVLVQQSRDSDLICRWGGEEFLILLPQCSLQAASQMAERMRVLIPNSLLSVGGDDMHITASFGVAEFNGAEASENLFSRADRALYQAKESGRNRVCEAA